MKRDLLFVADRLTSLLDENRLAILTRQHGVKKAKQDDSLGKLFAIFLRRAEDSTLGRVMVEAVILLCASRGNASQVLRDAATAYKVDTEATPIRSNRNSRRKRKPRRRKVGPPTIPSRTKPHNRAEAESLAEPDAWAPHFFVQGRLPSPSRSRMRGIFLSPASGP
jgi:ParB family transcriptional regulator, chromosome partitioning protein